jgi:hypothetical protein
MPQELLEGLASREGEKILEEIWPDIVNAYFKALSNPAPRDSPHSAPDHWSRRRTIVTRQGESPM